MSMYSSGSNTEQVVHHSGTVQRSSGMKLHDAEVIRLDFPASYRYLHVVSECIAELLNHVEQMPERESTVYGLQLAAHEVCTNIVGHAYGEKCIGRLVITLTLSPQPLQLVMEFHDTGNTFDINNVQPPNLEEAQVHGYGLFLIHSLMDTVVYTPSPGGNHWRLVKNLSQSV